MTHVGRCCHCNRVCLSYWTPGCESGYTELDLDSGSITLLNHPFDVADPLCFQWEGLPTGPIGLGTANFVEFGMFNVSSADHRFVSYLNIPLTQEQHDMSADLTDPIDLETNPLEMNWPESTSSPCTLAELGEFNGHQVETDYGVDPPTSVTITYDQLLYQTSGWTLHLDSYEVFEAFAEGPAGELHPVWVKVYYNSTVDKDPTSHLNVPISEMRKKFPAGPTLQASLADTSSITLWPMMLINGDPRALVDEDIDSDLPFPTDTSGYVVGGVGAFGAFQNPPTLFTKWTVDESVSARPTLSFSNGRVDVDALLQTRLVLDSPPAVAIAANFVSQNIPGPAFDPIIPGYTPDAYPPTIVANGSAFGVDPPNHADVYTFDWSAAHNADLHDFEVTGTDSWYAKWEILDSDPGATSGSANELLKDDDGSQFTGVGSHIFPSWRGDMTWQYDYVSPIPISGSISSGPQTPAWRKLGQSTYNETIDVYHTDARSDDRWRESDAFTLTANPESAVRIDGDENQDTFIVEACGARFTKKNGLGLETEEGILAGFDYTIGAGVFSRTACPEGGLEFSLEFVNDGYLQILIHVTNTSDEDMTVTIHYSDFTLDGSPLTSGGNFPASSVDAAETKSFLLHDDPLKGATGHTISGSISATGDTSGDPYTASESASN